MKKNMWPLLLGILIIIILPSKVFASQKCPYKVNENCYRYSAIATEYGGCNPNEDASLLQVMPEEQRKLYKQEFEEGKVSKYDGKCYYGLITEDESNSSNSGNNGSNGNNSPTITAQDCSLFGDPEVKGTPAYYISFAFKVVRYVAIVLLVVISVMDFISAVAASDNDKIHKAAQNALTRLVLCLVIFLLPTLIEWVLSTIYERSIDVCINTNM